MKNLNIKSLFNFNKKIILITGSSGQIGLSIVKLFLSLGSKVYGLDKTKSKIKHVDYKFIKADIENKNEVRKKINEIVKKNNRIDVIVNTAAVSIFSRYDKRTNSELDKTINTNIKGLLNVINAYTNIHKKNSLKKCSIINFGSIYGFLSPDFRIYGNKDRFSSEIYGASKAAVIQLTKYYSVALSNYNINVNCLSPGGIYNSKKPQNQKFIQKYSNRVPLNRMGNSENLFTGILFLASDQSNYVNGQNIIIDGGLSSW
jgi:NAD(P)-dependent dehydrogenase (short-subunit alcohol dehydrogenase family)|tara:strand:+ start:476 stop:1252 length:777 start_codon:yes stop_codon:yes gene_type:complete